MFKKFNFFLRCQKHNLAHQTVTTVSIAIAEKLVSFDELQLIPIHSHIGHLYV